MTTATLSAGTVRHLVAAEGYLELGLPAYALRELDAAGDPGPLEPHAQYLRGRTLMSQERYQEAIEPLRQAAPRLPAPHNRVAWLSLALCYRRGGDDALAEVAEALAKNPPEPPPVPLTVVEITILVRQNQEEHSRR